MCHLMAKTIQEPSRWRENGYEKTGPPIGRSVTIYSNRQKIKGCRVFLPDYLYLKENLIAADIETILSAKPKWLNAITPLFNILPDAKWVRSFLETYFYFIRGKLFKKVRTTLEISVGINKEFYHTLVVSDAFFAGGMFLKSCLQLIKNAGTKIGVNGFQPIEACFNFEEVIEIMREKESADLIVSWF